MIPSRRTWLAGSVLLVMAAAASAQLWPSVTGSGRIATETRTPGAFSALTAVGSIDVQVRQGERDQVAIEADDNLLPLIETSVDERNNQRTLVIRWKPGTSIRTHKPVSVRVTAQGLNAIRVDGSGDIRVDGMKSAELALRIDGSGDIRAQHLDAGALSIAIAGSGDLSAAGTAARATISIAGSGDVNTLGLAAADVKVSIAGSGDASVRADKTLAATIAGSGDVRYTGDPTVTQRVVGSGEVRRR